VGDGIIQQLGGSGPSDKPVDPSTAKEYTYSSLVDGDAYQIKAGYEDALF